MKKVFSASSLIVIFLSILIYADFVYFAFLVIYGLIIEPNLPQHWYGIGDFIELMYCFGLMVIAFFIFRIRRFYISLNFLERKLSLSNLFGISHFVIFRKLFTRSKELIFSREFIETKEPNQVYLINGICLPTIFYKSYFFGYSYEETENLIVLYKILFNNRVPEVIKIINVPVGSTCQFILEYQFRSIINWTVSSKGKGGFKVEYFEEMMVQNHFWNGMSVDGLSETMLKIKEQ
jgi:hypothetical protein